MQPSAVVYHRSILTILLVTTTALTLIFAYNSKSKIYPLLKVKTSSTNKSQQLISGSNNFTESPDTVGSIAAARDVKLFSASAEDKMLQMYIRVNSAANKRGAAVLKATITILANQRRVTLLKHSLQKLYEYFNHQFRYPVIIFHETNLKPHLNEIRAIGFHPLLNMSSIFFQEVDLSVPISYLKKFGQPPKHACGGVSNFGYRSMCRFQAKMIYEEPMMRHFDYQWRLDDDSILDRKISFDAFAALRNSGCSYGYFQTIIDTCAHNMFNVTVDYMRMRGIRPTFFHRLKWWEVFFNNFEVSNMKIWRSRQYRDFLEYIDSLGGIYTHRWGDAPIKTLALSMFVPMTEIYQFTNVSYRHHGLKPMKKT